jgi:hypothetical protein
MALSLKHAIAKMKSLSPATHTRTSTDLPALLFLAFMLRLLGLYSSPLWYDELLSLHRVGLPFWEHMAQNLNLWELGLRFFAAPALLRWPALICSLLTIWVAWQIMTLLQFNRIQCTMGMITLAVLPGLIWMSQDARYYSGVALIYMASIYFALERRWLGLFAVSGLAIYIHPTAPAYIVPAWLLILRSAPRRVLASSLLLIPIWTLRVIPAGGISNPDFWLKPPTFTDYLAQFGHTIGAKPDNLYPAVLFMALALAFAALRFRPAVWTIYLAPLVVLIGVSALVQPVAMYRTLLPSSMGLALLVGSAVPEGRSVWIYSSLAILLAVMIAQYDPSLHGGHVDLAAVRVRDAWQPGDCIQYETDFARVEVEPYLEGLPECPAENRSWLATIIPDATRIEFARTDGWHFITVYIYAPLESNFTGEGGPEHTIPATSSP